MGWRQEGSLAGKASNEKSIKSSYEDDAWAGVATHGHDTSNHIALCWFSDRQQRLEWCSLCLGWECSSASSIFRLCTFCNPSHMLYFHRTESLWISCRSVRAVISLFFFNWCCHVLIIDFFAVWIWFVGWCIQGSTCTSLQAIDWWWEYLRVLILSKLNLDGAV